MLSRKSGKAAARAPLVILPGAPLRFSDRPRRFPRPGTRAQKLKVIPRSSPASAYLANAKCGGRGSLPGAGRFGGAGRREEASVNHTEKSGPRERGASKYFIKRAEVGWQRTRPPAAGAPRILGPEEKSWKVPYIRIGCIIDEGGRADVELFIGRIQVSRLPRTRTASSPRFSAPTRRALGAPPSRNYISTRAASAVSRAPGIIWRAYCRCSPSEIMGRVSDTLPRPLAPGLAVDSLRRRVGDAEGQSGAARAFRVYEIARISRSTGQGASLPGLQKMLRLSNLFLGRQLEDEDWEMVYSM